MIEFEIDIERSEGQMNTFIVHPDENGPHPVILFLMDAPGKREELHNMARRIATCGYWVMLPNLYYRRVREFISDGTQKNREVMFEHKNSLSNDMVVEDCVALLEESLKLLERLNIECEESPMDSRKLIFRTNGKPMFLESFMILLLFDKIELGILIPCLCKIFFD